MKLAANVVLFSVSLMQGSYCVDQKPIQTITVTVCDVMYNAQNIFTNQFISSPPLLLVWARSEFLGSLEILVLARGLRLFTSLDGCMVKIRVIIAARVVAARNSRKLQFVMKMSQRAPSVCLRSTM